jgi:valyl-tRNA synthetase
MIEKTYQPAEIETRMSRLWEDAGAFKAGRPERRDAKPFTIVIPPPNVTGSLHMGHALNNTLQDVLCRFERMRGRDVLWQPGTDHAGIATQMVVERQLMERQQPGRREMGRAKFLERVWEWKAESGGVIVNQLKRLGASCDWSRERFTMGQGGAPDDQMVRAVMKAFVTLYNDGLIYKDKRLVNWDPALLTAISDLEVQQIEHRGSFGWSRDSGEAFNAPALRKMLARDPNGHLYYINYPIKDVVFDPTDPSTFITVATTRPETMLGDTAIAVHPENERLKRLIDEIAIVPLANRDIPIIGDDYADPEKGTGAVKITPAHDFNDFEVGRKHGLSLIIIFDAEAKVKRDPWEYFDFPKPSQILPKNLASIGGGSPGEIPSELAGLDRFAARSRIVEMLAEQGFLSKVEPHGHAVPHGDRSGVEVEPYLTAQWYVHAKTLAQPALQAVREGKTSFVPKNWEKTYYDWMENIQPWCISRQLWWGHQIPVWYGSAVDEQGFKSEGPYKEFVAETEQAALAEAKRYYGPDVKVVIDINPFSDARQESDGRWKLETVGIGRDPDVLDTWFSSALWPFSTLGWPDDTKDVKRYYPTDVLVTGFDIIFFWVARMMMMGIHFMQKERPAAPLEEVVPFPTVYIHALVRDAKGAKMSKSKGNVIDPLSLIDEYGADALRFTLAAMAAQGRDIKLDTQRVAGYRNFATKLWNACRFAEMNDCVLPPGFDPTATKETFNRWIVGETARTAGVVDWKLKDYKFNEAAGELYTLVWNIYCDWYLELAKPVLLGEQGPAKEETRATVAWVRDQILKLLHPFMPFITEELWSVTARREQLLVLADWPDFSTDFDDSRSYSDAGAEAEIGWLIELITAIRSVRSEMNISAHIPIVLVGAGEYAREHALNWADFIKRLVRVSEISFADTAPQGSVQLVVRGVLVALSLKGIIDLDAENKRLQRELAKAEANVKRLDAKLANERFIANVPEEVVEEEKEKLEEANLQRAKILDALERLKNAS